MIIRPSDLEVNHLINIFCHHPMDSSNAWLAFTVLFICLYKLLYVLVLFLIVLCLLSASYGTDRSIRLSLQINTSWRYRFNGPLALWQSAAKMVKLCFGSCTEPKSIPQGLVICDSSLCLVCISLSLVVGVTDHMAPSYLLLGGVPQLSLTLSLLTNIVPFSCMVIDLSVSKAQFS